MRRLVLTVLATALFISAPGIATAKIRVYPRPSHPVLSCHHSTTLDTCSFYNKKGGLAARLTRKKYTSPDACSSTTYSDVKVTTCDETVTLRVYRRHHVVRLESWTEPYITVEPQPQPQPQPGPTVPPGDQSGMFCGKGGVCEIYDTDGQLVVTLQRYLLFDTCRPVLDGYPSPQPEVCTKRTQMWVYGKSGRLIVTDVQLDQVLYMGKGSLGGEMPAPGPAVQ